MKEPYAEGLANHGDRESCECVRKDIPEALTAACAGWVLSRENKNSKTRTPTQLLMTEGNIGGFDMRETSEFCVVKDPIHAQKLHAREPGEPTFDPFDRNVVRSGNPQGGSR